MRKKSLEQMLLKPRDYMMITRELLAAEFRGLSEGWKWWLFKAIWTFKTKSKMSRGA
jgi:hypothetical protein